MREVETNFVISLYQYVKPRVEHTYLSIYYLKTINNIKKTFIIQMYKLYFYLANIILINTLQLCRYLLYFDLKYPKIWKRFP